uniref:Thioredoxin H-type 2 n=1 Tax=Cajanus cajan TaxID=3821 RepID=A0A151QZ95_CAJCA|nr:Thioredoxin H-type 2 [Cajanus cajan]
MGANFSTYVEKSSPSSLILTFNSTAKWKAHFDASKETNKLMVIDFTATWCGPCKYMDPIIKESLNPPRECVVFRSFPHLGQEVTKTQEYKRPRKKN